MFTCTGIPFDHESPRRGETFVTRKITRGLANIVQGLGDCLYIGNIDALCDWRHAKDYVRMQWMLLQHDTPGDFVIATGKQNFVREFVSWMVEDLGTALRFEGKGVEEHAIVDAVNRSASPAVKMGDVIIRIFPRCFRPAEVETLLGDPTKAKETLGWEPEFTAREICVEIAVEDLKTARRCALLKEDCLHLPVSVEN